MEEQVSYKKPFTTVAEISCLAWVEDEVRQKLMEKYDEERPRDGHSRNFRGISDVVLKLKRKKSFHKVREFTFTPHIAVKFFFDDFQVPMKVDCLPCSNGPIH